MRDCFCCDKSPEPQEGPRPQRQRRHQRQPGNHRHRHHVDHGHGGRHVQHRRHVPQEHYEYEEDYGNQVYEVDRRQHQGEQGAQHNEAYELSLIPTTTVRTLQEVDYVVSDPVESRHPTLSERMMVYEISYPATKTRDNVIGIFGIWQDPSQLVIERIYTINDTRPDDEKPHANEIILSFWGLYLRRDITSLRSLFFKEVEEIVLQDAKPRVYAEMRKDGRGMLRICEGRSEIEDAQFVDLSINTKFGRLAHKILERNEVMKRAQLKVVEFMFLPFSRDVEEFHFKISFG